MGARSGKGAVEKNCIFLFEMVHFDASGGRFRPNVIAAIKKLAKMKESL